MWVFREASGSNPYPVAYFTCVPPTIPTLAHPTSGSSAPGDERVPLGLSGRWLEQGWGAGFPHGGALLGKSWSSWA